MRLLLIVVCTSLIGCNQLPAAASAANRGRDEVLMFPNPLFDVGGQPFCGATADLDHDGRADLVVCSYGLKGGLTILMGRGNGAFAPRDRIDTGGEVKWVTSADFHRDGVVDLLAVQEGRILMLPGKGNGDFWDPFETALPNLVTVSAAIADFDRDGLLDVAVASLMTATVEILLGRNDRTFTREASLAVGQRPGSVVTGDFNGDGRADLATANIGSHDVSVLYGREHGFDDERRFGLKPPAYSVEGTYYYHFVAAADLNSDGRTDLVVSHQDSATASVLLGSADGTLIADGEYPVGSFPLSPEVADVNGDGNGDIIVGSYASEVFVFLGDGKGAFSPKRSSGVCEGPGAMMTGKFDGDPFLDAAVACRNSMSVGIFHGNADGTFGSGHEEIQAGLGAWFKALAAGELDRHRGADLVVAPLNKNQVIVMNDFVDGRSRSRTAYEVGWNPTAVTIGRLNEDQHRDLAVVVRNFDPVRDGPSDCRIGGRPEPPAPPPHGEAVVLLGQGDGRFQSASRVEVGYRPTDISAADLNGDGLDDLVVASEGEPRIEAPGCVSILLAGKNGAFGPERRLLEGPAYTNVDLADFDADGHLDLVVANVGLADATLATVSLSIEYQGQGSLAVYFGTPNGFSADPTVLDSAWQGGCVAVADMNADGKPDVVATNAGTAVRRSSAKGSTLIYFSRPGRAFAPSEPIESGPPLCVAVTDFNVDRRPDLAVLNGSHEISVLLGTPGGGFDPRVRFSGAGPIDRFLAADIDGDGRPDLVGSTGGGISTLLNRRSRRR